MKCDGKAKVSVAYSAPTAAILDIAEDEDASANESVRDGPSGNVARATATANQGATRAETANQSTNMAHTRTTGSEDEREQQPSTSAAAYGGATNQRKTRAGPPTRQVKKTAHKNLMKKIAILY